MIYNLLTVEGTDYETEEKIQIDKVVSTYNSTSSFTATFRNDNGEVSDTFSLNDDILIKADLDTNPPTTKIFRGIIENIQFSGQEQSEELIISGRDYGAVLQDVIVSPRIFKKTEASEIIKSLMRQNAIGTGITHNSVDATGITIDKITFNGVSLYDAIKQLAEITDYYFYVDEDKDLNFKQKDNVSSGLTFDNTNVTQSVFSNSDEDIFNEVKVLGARQETFTQQIFDSTAGSVYTLTDKPYNVKVQISGTSTILYQPGGILNISNPAVDNVQFMVDFNSKQIILTSGTVAGDNLIDTGSSVLVDYFRSTPLIKTQKDIASINSYGLKKKEITDKNIADLSEATDIANAYITEHKDPTIEGILTIRNVADITPGETCVVDVPFHDVDNKTYSMIRAQYIFTPENNFSDEVLSLTVNRKVLDFVDMFKQHELRLRSLETSEVESSITNVEVFTGSIGISGICTIIQESIGSGFYFHTDGADGRHDILESPSSLLGVVEGGSTVTIL